MIVKLPTRRFAVMLAICAGFTLLFMGLTAGRSPLLTRAEFLFQDWLASVGRRAPADPQLVLIGIDRPAYEFDLKEEDIAAEPVLAALQRTFPWSRDVWARLIEQLAEAGARVIAVDLVFATASERDEHLRDALARHGSHVVVGANFLKSQTDQRDFASLQFPGATLLTPPAEHHPLQDERIGLINIWPDDDGVLRRAYFRRTGGDLEDVLPQTVLMESLAARILRRAGQADRIPPGTQARRIRFTASASQGFRQHAIGDVLSPSTWKANYGEGEFFRDKIVLIGPTAPIMQDVHLTPLGNISGPEIQLNLVNAALHQEFFREFSPVAQQALYATTGALVLAFSLLWRQPIKRLLIMGIVAATYLLAAVILYNQRGPAALILPVATPLLIVTLCGVSTLAYDYLLERFEKRRIRRTLERYVSRDVVKELLDNPQTYFNTLGGVRKPVTILFSDVRGFTTLTENADSAALVKQLNEYFEEMVSLVFAHQGSLDKFIGDAVMAVWGNIVSHGAATDAHNAVATALAMKRSLKKLNEDWKARGMLELAFGIGLNHGEVIVGNLGSSEKMELTVIGDAVNLASRLEGLTKEYHLDLLLGESMAKLAGDQYILRLVDCVQVKGKTRPVDVYTVMGEGAGQTVSLPLWLARYEEGVRLYRGRKFKEAATLFEECHRRDPEDYLSAMYVKRCSALIENPPDESWNGVFVMTKK